MECKGIKLLKLLNLLEYLYSIGVDIIDMRSEVNKDGSSTLFIEFGKEGMSEEFKKQHEDTINELSDDDINLLI